MVSDKLGGGDGGVNAEGAEDAEGDEGSVESAECWVLGWEADEGGGVKGEERLGLRVRLRLGVGRESGRVVVLPVITLRGRIELADRLSALHGVEVFFFSDEASTATRRPSSLVM